MFQKYQYKNTDFKQHACMHAISLDNIAPKTEQRYLLHDDKNEIDDNADYDDYDNADYDEEDDINNLFLGSQTKAFTALQIFASLATAFIKEMLPPTVKG